MKIHVLSLLTSIFTSMTSFAGIEFNATTTASGDYQYEKSRAYSALMRVLPDVRYRSEESEWKFDSQLTGNFWAATESSEQRGVQRSRDGEVYRLWGRYANASTEYRLGLQQINFGPAKILRTLRWFDQLDRRDPTNFTKGVQGLLFRHYFADDANIWLWALYENTDPAGPIPLVARRDQPEMGGRYQWTLSGGEFAISTHYRQLDSEKLSPTSTDMDALSDAEESRLALDGFWDVYAGVWFEASWTKFTGNPILAENVYMGTLGTDYTFDIGNGLYSMVEIFGIATADNELAATESFLFAASQSYPLGLIDNLRFYWIKCLDCGGSSVSLEFQRTYDNWLINLAYSMTESNPEASVLTSASGVTSGRSVRFLIQHNL